MYFYVRAAKPAEEEIEMDDESDDEEDGMEFSTVLGKLFSVSCSR